MQSHQNLQKYSNRPSLDIYRSPESFLECPALVQRIYCVLGPVLSIFKQKMKKKTHNFIADGFDHPYTVLNYCGSDRELFKAHILCAIGQGNQLIINLGRGIIKGEAHRCPNNQVIVKLFNRFIAIKLFLCSSGQTD